MSPARPQALFALLTCCSTAAATEIPGGTLRSDATWRAAGSPYEVLGDVTVPPGVTLRIEPGVEARFVSHDALKSGKDSERVELRIEGKLQADGSEAQPILLHAATSGYANAWYGVIIPEGGDATLSHIWLEDANTAVSHEARTQLLLSHAVLRHNFTGLSVRAGSATLDGVVLTDNSVQGLDVQASDADASCLVRNGLFRLNGSYGAGLYAAHGHIAQLSLENGTVYGNTSAGVRVVATGSGTHATAKIRNSIVAANGIAGVQSRAEEGAQVEVTTTYSDVSNNGVAFEGALGGQGCFSEDPRFIDAPADLRLLPDSPCIDAGSAQGPPGDDLLRRARPLGAGVDLGAYEHAAEDVPAPSGGASMTGADAPALSGAGGDLVETPTSSGGAGGDPSQESAAGTAAAGAAPAPQATSATASGFSCRLSRRQGGSAFLRLSLGLLALILRRRALVR